MLNRIHSPQNCLSSLWDKSFLQERGIASFFLTEKNTFENTPLFDGIFRYLLIQKGTAQITITGLDDYIIGMDAWNLRNMNRITGGDPDGKIHLLLDYSKHPRDIADPWYTGNFDDTYRDVVEGCEAFMKYLGEEQL